jgi:hypothetical protein
MRLPRPYLLIALGSIAFALCALLWAQALPPIPPPGVSVVFLGYTNDSSGNKLGRVAITNLNRTVAYVYMPLVSIKSPVAPIVFWVRSGTNVYANPSCAWLQPNASQTFLFPVPEQESSWKPIFRVYPDKGPRWVIKGLANVILCRTPFCPSYPTGPHHAQGNWIDTAE